MRLTLLLLCIVFLGCKQSEETLSAQQIIDKAITISNGEKVGNAHIGFDFRKYHYEAKRNNGNYALTKQKTDSLGTLKEVLSNEGYKRYINDEEVVVPDSMVSRYANSVNSVHYFSVLPFGLNDTAVFKKLLPSVKIKGKDYYKIQITFSEEGGGDDFEDVFIYWIDKISFTVDYLAYEFHVNGGGMRFREAYNVRTVEGIQFADYKNYKPNDSSTQLNELDKAFEADGLKLLSTIDLKNITVQ